MTDETLSAEKVAQHAREQQARTAMANLLAKTERAARRTDHEYAQSVLERIDSIQRLMSNGEIHGALWESMMLGAEWEHVRTGAFTDADSQQAEN